VERKGCLSWEGMKKGKTLIKFSDTWGKLGMCLKVILATFGDQGVRNVEVKHSNFESY